MKKLFLLLSLMLLLALQSFAQSSFTVFSEDGHRFWLIVNGIRQNDSPVHRVEVTGLSEPRYRIKIIFEDERIPEIDQSITVRDMLEDSDAHTTYRIRKHRRRDEYVLSMVSWEEVSAPVAQTNTYSAPLHTNETKVETKPAVAEHEQHKVSVSANVNEAAVNQNISAAGASVDISITEGGQRTGISLEIDIPEGMEWEESVEYSQEISVHETRTKPEQIHKQVHAERVALPGYSGPVGCPVPMSDTDFARALQAVKNQTFEDDKLSTAKQVARNNCLLVSQVKAVIEVFTFEDSKLEFAKFAYSRTLDYGRYYELNDAFTFSSSVEELNKFVERQSR
ncbi:MAG: DUF4476 domain-containing protein [Bacteroidetes bacterium]|nr:MAG: DUF4476 domain-containing protein [Bacteroidota bacterium]